MKEEEFKARWEAGISTSDPAIVDLLWNGIPQEDKDDALRSPKVGLEDLVADAEERLGRKQSRPKPVGRSQRVEFTPWLRPEEAERRATLEEYLAYAAGFDPDLRRFREKVLGGHLITPEQTRDLILSPAARFFDLSLFDNWGIPIVGHTASLEDYRRERTEGWGFHHRATVSVHPPGITETVLRFSVEPPSSMGSAGAASEVELQRLAFVGEDGYVHEFTVWRRSLLDELRGWSEKLAKRYCWHPAQATMFVLTGEIPACPSLKTWYEPKRSMGGIHASIFQGVVTLEIAPWMSAKTVHRAYRDIQRRVLRGDNRPIKEKNLRLLRFVMERLEPAGLLEEGEPPKDAEDWMIEPELVAYGCYEKKPKGRDLVREWDEQYPDWAYHGDTRRFWRDYQHTRRRIAYPVTRRPPLDEH